MGGPGPITPPRCPEGRRDNRKAKRGPGHRANPTPNLGIRTGRAPHPRVLYARVLAAGSPQDFHVRVRVQSDDLPDAVVERVKNYVVHIPQDNP